MPSRHILTRLIQAIAAMAADTKHSVFAITSSTSHETPFLLVRRLSTLDQELILGDNKGGAIRTHVGSFVTTKEDDQKWTARRVAEFASVGGFAPLGVSSPSTVADEMERWIRDAYIDGFNLVSVVTPGSLEDVVKLLIPELRKHGLHQDRGKMSH